MAYCGQARRHSTPAAKGASRTLALQKRPSGRLRAHRIQALILVLVLAGPGQKCSPHPPGPRGPVGSCLQHISALGCSQLPPSACGSAEPIPEEGEPLLGRVDARCRPGGWGGSSFAGGNRPEAWGRRAEQQHLEHKFLFCIQLQRGQ